MPTKLIENRIQENAFSDFGKGFLSGLGSSVSDKLGIKNETDKDKYNKAISWFNKHDLKAASIPGVKADVLSSNLNNLKLDIIIGQNDGNIIYIKIQDIVCPFSYMERYYGEWQESDTAVILDYANMSAFYRENDKDKKYTGSQQKKFKLLETKTDNFNIIYSIISEYNIPMLNPNKLGINPSAYNKLMLSGGDITEKKNANLFLVKYMFMLIYVNFNTLEKVRDFANNIGARDIDDVIKDEDIVKDILSKAGGDTKSDKYKNLVSQQRRKIAIAGIVKQIFGT